MSYLTFFNFVNFMTSLTFYICLILISLVYLTAYMFGFMGTSTAHDILAVLVMYTIVALPALIWKYKTTTKSFKENRNEVIVAVVLLTLWLGASIFLVIVGKGVCICVFNDNYGIKINKDFVFSTQWSRCQEIEKVCADGKLCHIYATLGEDTAHSVFINAHTGIDVGNLTITLTTGASTFTQTITNPLSLASLEPILQRNVHHAYFDKLTPDSLYNITVTNTDNGVVLAQTAYLTLPDADAEEVRLAMGGDVGLDELAKNLTAFLVDFKPHVVIIGGDIAYDDGMKTCLFSWDNFYQLF